MSYLNVGKPRLMVISVVAMGLLTEVATDLMRINTSLCTSLDDQLIFVKGE